MSIDLREHANNVAQALVTWVHLLAKQQSRRSRGQISC